MTTVIFDLDGTLSDSRDLALAAAAEGLGEFYRELGREPVIPPAEAIAPLIGAPSLDYFRGLVPPQLAGHAERIRVLVGRHEITHLRAGQGKVFPGARELLAAVRARDWRLGLVSNCGRPYFEASLDGLALRPFFDVAFCLDDGPPGAATKTGLIRCALERLGTRTGFVVGDRAWDIEAGRANGLTTIAVTYGFGRAEELVAADHRAGSPQEVGHILFNHCFGVRT